MSSSLLQRTPTPAPLSHGKRSLSLYHFQLSFFKLLMINCRFSKSGLRQGRARCLKVIVFRRERLGVGPEEPELAAETNLTLSTEPAKANIDAYVWM